MRSITRRASRSNAAPVRLTSKVAAALGLIFALLAGLGVTTSSVASAADGPPPPPIVDYANYPDGIAGLVPPGCNGTNVLEGLQFTVNGGAPNASLSAFTLAAGDNIVMTWTGFGQGCAGAGISLSVKEAATQVFDPLDNQQLVLPFAYCGPGGASCDGNTLSLTVPTLTVTCNFQIDAVIGPPLAVVGPNGSYYNSLTRGDHGKAWSTAQGGTNMLISANNGGIGHCNLPPTADTELSCAEGGLLVTVVNPDNFDAITVTISKDGVPVFTPGVPANGSVDRLVPLDEGVPAAITIVARVDGVLVTLFNQTVTLDCMKPQATVEARCAEGQGTTGALVTLTNPGAESDAVFTVNGVQHVIAPNGSEAFVLPGAEGSTLQVTVTAVGEAAPLFDEPVLVDCVNPAATLTHSCADGGTLVNLTNPAGQLPAVFTITVDGTPFGSTVTVAGGATSSVLVPMTEGQTSTITVTEASEANPLASQAITQDCVNPSASLREECAANGGAQFTYTNSGASSVDLTVTKNGTVIDTVTVPAGQTVTKTYPLAEDETGTFRVTGPGYDSGALPVNHDCAQVLPFEAERGSAALARTGSEVEPMLLLSALLLVLGGAFVGLGQLPALVGNRRSRRHG